MAVSNSLKRKQEAAQKKLTPTQLREKVAKLEEKLENSATCYLCGELKNVSHFYTSTDPMAKSGLTPVCKKCATNIACRIDANGELVVHHLSADDEMQVIIESEQWFAAELPGKKGFSLVGCAVAPAFKFDNFELANKDDLLREFPQHRATIERLCR